MKLKHRKKKLNCKPGYEQRGAVCQPIGRRKTVHKSKGFGKKRSKHNPNSAMPESYGLASQSASAKRIATTAILAAGGIAAGITAKTKKFVAPKVSPDVEARDYRQIAAIGGTAAFLGIAVAADRHYKISDPLVSHAAATAHNGIVSIKDLDQKIDNSPLDDETKAKAKNLVGTAKVFTADLALAKRGYQKIKVDPDNNSVYYQTPHNSIRSISSVGSSIVTSELQLVTKLKNFPVYEAGFKIDNTYDRKTVKGKVSKAERRKAIALARRADRLYEEQLKLIPDNALLRAKPHKDDGAGEKRKSIYEKKGFTNVPEINKDYLFLFKNQGQIHPIRDERSLRTIYWLYDQERKDTAIIEKQLGLIPGLMSPDYVQGRIDAARRIGDKIWVQDRRAKAGGYWRKARSRTHSRINVAVVPPVERIEQEAPNRNKKGGNTAFKTALALGATGIAAYGAKKFAQNLNYKVGDIVEQESTNTGIKAGVAGAIAGAGVAGVAGFYARNKAVADTRKAAEEELRTKLEITEMGDRHRCAKYEAQIEQLQAAAQVDREKSQQLESQLLATSQDYQQQLAQSQQELQREIAQGKDPRPLRGQQKNRGDLLTTNGGGIALAASHRWGSGFFSQDITAQQDKIQRQAEKLLAKAHGDRLLSLQKKFTADIQNLSAKKSDKSSDRPSARLLHQAQLANTKPQSLVRELRGNEDINLPRLVELEQEVARFNVKEEVFNYIEERVRSEAIASYGKSIIQFQENARNSEGEYDPSLITNKNLNQFDRESRKITKQVNTQLDNTLNQVNSPKFTQRVEKLVTDFQESQPTETMIMRRRKQVSVQLAEEIIQEFLEKNDSYAQGIAQAQARIKGINDRFEQRQVTQKQNKDSIIAINFDAVAPAKIAKTSPKRTKKLKCKPGFKQQGAVCKPVKKSSNALATTAIAATGAIAASQGINTLVKSTKLQQDHEAKLIAGVTALQEQSQAILKQAGGFDDLGQFISDKQQVFQQSLKQITKPDQTLDDTVYRTRQLKLAKGTLAEVAKGKIPSNRKPKSWLNPQTGAGDRLAQLTLASGRRREELLGHLTKYRKAPATPEEMSALEFYTTPRGVAHINNTLRGNDQRLKNYLSQTNDDYNLKTAKRIALYEAKLAASALSKLPKHQGNVYRGVEFDAKTLAKYTPGTVVSDPGFASTTRNPLKKFGGNTQMVIRSKNGRYISDYMNKYQEEVLFAPETKFRINKVSQQQIGEKEYSVLFMEEI